MGTHFEADSGTGGNASAASGKPAEPVEGGSETPSAGKFRIFGRSFTRQTAAKYAVRAGAILPSIGLAVTVLWRVGTEAFDNSIVIHPVSVPPALAESGYSSSVVAERLGDAISALKTRARSGMKSVPVTLDVGASEIRTPASDGSFDAIISAGLRMVGLSAKKDVSGEIIVDDGQYRFTTRAGDNATAPITVGPEPRQNLQHLFELAARAVTIRTQPFLVAAADRFTDPDRSYAEANDMIYQLEEGDPGVARAYNLRGILHYEKHQCKDAEANYRKAIQLDGSMFEPHMNLGIALHCEGRNKEAVDEFHRAIARGRTNALSHDAFGLFLLDTHDYDGAIAEDRIAIRLDGSDGQSHDQLGAALWYKGDKNQGITELKRAIHLGYNDAHEDLALALTYKQHPDSARMSEACMEITLAEHFGLTKSGKKLLKDCRASNPNVNMF